MDTEGRTQDTLFHQLWHSDRIDENVLTMFFGASNFNAVLNNWNVSRVLNMKSMFAFANYRIPIVGWNLNPVVNMEGMFRQHNVHHTREIEDEHVLRLYSDDE